MSRAQPSDPGAIARPNPEPDAPRFGIERLRAWTGRLRGRRAARAALEAAALRLWRDLVASARAPGFFGGLGVPDTPEGRFEMIGLHAALILLRLQREGAAGRALGQALFDLMFADLDQSLRELGVGDLGVGRQVKRLAGQFYARLRALEAVVERDGAGRPPDGDGAGRLGPMLRANVWHGGSEPSAAQVGALADYLIRSARRLDDQSAGALLRGEATFAGLDG
jgi:cytochrome b pre-mRNA-processing protein 3